LVQPKLIIGNSKVHCAQNVFSIM